MTITIEIPPGVEAELTRRAAARGLGIEMYAASLLEEAAGVSVEPPQTKLDRLEHTLGDLAQFSDKIPSLPDEAFSRGSLYQDHD